MTLNVLRPMFQLKDQNQNYINSLHLFTKINIACIKILLIFRLVVSACQFKY